jgi:hypothetical protein
MTHKDGVNVTRVFALNFLHEMRLMRCYKAALMIIMYPTNACEELKRDGKIISDIFTCEEGEG